jgi:glycosyltransferase involved in cell wall biosynthesis
VGGAVERHVYCLIRALAKFDFHIAVVSDFRPGFEIDGVETYKVHGIASSFRRGFFGWLLAFSFAGILVALASIRAIVSQVRVDVIHFHDAFSGLLFVVLRRAGLVKCRLVFTLHGYPISGSSIAYTGLKRVIMYVARDLISYVVRNCDAVVVFSQNQLFAASKAYRAPYACFVVIPQISEVGGIDSNLYEARFTHALYVGRLASLKGVNYLLEALQTTGIQCRLVGDGPEMGALMNMAEQLGIVQNIEFVGEFPHEQVLKEYSKASLFVLPTLAEGFPMVLLEAMATGLPVITTNVSGIDETVIDLQNGLLVEKMNPVGLRAALVRLSRDHELREILGRKARETVLRKHHPDSVARRVASLYLKLALGVDVMQ